MAKQQTLTIIVPDDCPDPADLIVVALRDRDEDGDRFAAILTQEQHEDPDHPIEYLDGDSVLILEEV